MLKTVAGRYLYYRLSNTRIIKHITLEIYGTTNLASANGSCNFRFEIIKCPAWVLQRLKRDLKPLVDSASTTLLGQC